MTLLYLLLFREASILEQYHLPSLPATLSLLLPSEYRSFKKGNAVYANPKLVPGVSIYKRHREIKRRSDPKGRAAQKTPTRGLRSALAGFVLYLHRFSPVMHSDERNSLRIGGYCQHRGAGETRRSGHSGNQTAIAIFISARFFLFPVSPVIFIRVPPLGLAAAREGKVN